MSSNIFSTILLTAGLLAATFQASAQKSGGEEKVPQLTVSNLGGDSAALAAYGRPYVALGMNVDMIDKAQNNFANWMLGRKKDAGLELYCDDHFQLYGSVPVIGGRTLLVSSDNADDEAFRMLSYLPNKRGGFDVFIKDEATEDSVDAQTGIIMKVSLGYYLRSVTGTEMQEELKTVLKNIPAFDKNQTAVLAAMHARGQKPMFEQPPIRRTCSEFIR